MQRGVTGGAKEGGGGGGLGRRMDLVVENGSAAAEAHRRQGVHVTPCLSNSSVHLVSCGGAIQHRAMRCAALWRLHVTRASNEGLGLAVSLPIMKMEW